MNAPSSVLASVAERDIDAFRAAVAALDVHPDADVAHDHPLIAWVARQDWAAGVKLLVEAGAQPVVDGVELVHERARHARRTDQNG